MASLELSSDEEKAVHSFIENVNILRQHAQQTPLPWNSAVKFLMARKFDLQRAFDLYMAHQEIRQQEGLLDIDVSDQKIQTELHTQKFTVLQGRDNHGAAVAIFTARLHVPTLTSHQVVLKALVYMLDAALESRETQRQGLVFIYDMTDSKYSNFDYDLSSKILTMLKGAYPARLKKVLIVTAPLWFKAPFKILRLFVREKLRDRVYTISQSQLPTHIPLSALPQKLGGTLSVNHAAWLQLCAAVSANQNPDVDSYFLSRRRQSQFSQRKSLNSSGHSDVNEYLFVSDIDSSDSKETVSEKHSVEEGEKESEKLERNGAEKEVNFEKEEGNSSAGKRRRESDPASGKVSSNVGRENTQMETDGSEASSHFPFKKRPTSGSNIFEDSIHMAEEGGFIVGDLVKHMTKVRRRGLYDEYAVIKREPPMGTFNFSKAKYNLPKNRYSDVLCLDHSRVMLPQKDGDPSADYINANFVDGYMQKHAYISTQGPLPKTFGDFWRMVWQTQCVVVVMTTRAMERGRVKCGQYWPAGEESEEQYDDFIVINTGLEQNQDYTITGLHLHNTQTNESRQITHLQFTSWPDYGIPHHASGFLDFLFRVRACQADAVKLLEPHWQGHPNGPPIVVHCSAGIGRTGTFITVDIGLHRLNHIGTVDVHQTVRRIRSQRAFSIQMPDQYVFCHLAIVEYAVKQGMIPQPDWTTFEDSESDTE